MRRRGIALVLALCLLAACGAVAEESPLALLERELQAFTDAAQAALASPRATVWGPYGTISELPPTAAAAMLANLQEVGAAFYPEDHGGTACYRFVRGTDTVYVKASAFARAAPQTTYPGERLVSAALTEGFGRADAPGVACTTSRSAFDGETGAYVWDLVLTGAGTERPAEHLVRLCAGVLCRARVLSFVDVLRVAPPGDFGPRPTAALALAHPGVRRPYLGGYCLAGRGTDRARTAPDDPAYPSLLLDRSGHGYAYRSMEAPVDSEGRRAAQCAVQSPFRLEAAGSVYRLEVGIVGDDTACRAAVAWHFA